MDKEEIKEIENRIPQPMSDADLERYSGVKDSDIIKYSELKNYNTIEDVLPTDKSFKIILIEEKYNNGHFVAIMRYNKTIEFFNSYGGKPDADWKFVNRMMRIILGEGTNELTRLFKQAKQDGWDTIYNTTQFQKLSSKVNTCGRWAVLRIEMMRMGYNLEQFTDFIHTQKKKLGKPYDFVVAKFIK